MIQDFYETSTRHAFARGWSIVVTHGSPWPLAMAGRVAGWGAEHKAQTKRLFGHVVGLASIGEQLPDLRNRVTLDPIVKDSFGLPVPRLIDDPRENDQAMIKVIRGQLGELLDAAGAMEILDNEYSPGGQLTM